MSLYIGFYCPKCGASSIHPFNHGELACREILANWNHISAIRNTTWIEVDTLGNHGHELFSFLEDHFVHGIVIEDEYGKVIKDKTE